MKEGPDLDIPAAGGDNEGGKNGGYKDINSLESEYSCAIHCDAADSGPMRAGHPEARRAGVSAVVGTGRDRPEGSARKGGGSSSGNGTGVRGQAGRSRGRRRRGGIPGSERV